MDRTPGTNPFNEYRRSNWLKNNNPYLRSFNMHIKYQEQKELIFPDLYPETYQDLINQSSILNDKVETYGKYIKEQIGGKDPRFRLHYTWPAYLYTNKPIINEQITTTLPTFIRIGDSYFHEKEHHVNIMINNYGLPQLFITLIMNKN
ncbi:hypothetical protein C1645_839581 [Glomus cerebriforme]|uniref:Uncharacterized protein n=1 Tax=Glomus cerebriforme TaxID=658196 RepID=A0A397SC48_9GLOM|nr:hypothetical protein C1645_839581 [Glomus cerebriforme]